MCLDFNLFGLNIILGLNSARYFEYLAMSGASVFCTLITRMRLAFIVVRMQNLNNPQIYNRAFSNPFIKYIVKLTIFISIFYVGSFFIIPYYWFNYYLMVFYVYPIIQIIHTAKTGSRKCFKWQYQLLQWPTT